MLTLKSNEGKHCHQIFLTPEEGNISSADQANSIQLVENRGNAISIPIMEADGVNTREMIWNDTTHKWQNNAGTPTRISEIIRHINDRCLGSSTLNDTVVTRVEAIDADTGNLFVFVPGTTSTSTDNNFEIIIEDQEGDYESRGFTMFLQANANAGSNDGGEVWIRFNNNSAGIGW